jgi:thioredoxin 2
LIEHRPRHFLEDWYTADGAMNLVVCGKCGGVNRLPPALNAKDAKCGKCCIRLFSGYSETVDAQTFDRWVK